MKERHSEGWVGGQDGNLGTLREMTGFNRLQWVLLRRDA